MANCIKVTYATAQAAKHVLRIVAMRYALRGQKIPVAIYPCKACSGWHLTSQTVGGRWRKWNLLVQREA